jgi:micrococcal nuclease
MIIEHFPERRAVARMVALVGALLLAACSRSGLERLAPGETGRVVEVFSGDALRLDTGLEVRLAGVEAPKGEQPFANEARGALERLVQGKRVQLLYGGARRDRYGRALAQVEITGADVWVERVLLRQGAVRVRTWSDNRAMASAMLEDEAYARNRGLGLWRLSAYRVLLPVETEGTGGFQIVEGRPLGIGPSGNGGAELQFAHGPGDRFSVQIDGKAQADFRTAGKDPAALAGRLIRLRGPIRYGPDGPVMRLDHPEQVELLKGSS